MAVKRRKYLTLKVGEENKENLQKKGYMNWILGDKQDKYIGKTVSQGTEAWKIKKHGPVGQESKTQKGSGCTWCYHDPLDVSSLLASLAAPSLSISYLSDSSGLCSRAFSPLIFIIWEISPSPMVSVTIHLLTTPKVLSPMQKTFLNPDLYI